MEAVTKRFITPPTPVAAKKEYIYPWEHTELAIMCQRLYILAAKTGFEGTLEDFKEHFGAYLESHNIFSSDDLETYMGQYEVTPLPLVDQILSTRNKVLTDNIVVAQIPFHATLNEAGGRTVTIG